MDASMKKTTVLSRFHQRALILFFILTGLFLECSKETNLVQNPFGHSEITINITSGDNQTGKGGELLDKPVILQILDSEEKPVKNMEINVVVVEGGGRIVNSTDLFSDFRGFAEIEWQIGSGYNAARVSVSNELYPASPCYIYAQGENPVGMNITRTLNSLKQEGNNFYSMSFYGDYTDMLENVNRRYVGGVGSGSNLEKNYFCSLFTAFGNTKRYLFGRSFDNPAGWECLTLMGRFNPPDGYRSIAPSRMRDYGYQIGTNFDNLSSSQKTGLMEAAFFVPDGINEHGVVVALANCPPVQFYPEPGKKSIYMTYFVREILDHARNLDEAIQIAGNYNIIFGDIADVHVLIGDASGRSAVLEYFDMELRVIPNIEKWQVATNRRVYNLSVSEQKNSCWRFRTVYDALKDVNGNIDHNQGIIILDSVNFPSTEWSAIYDMTEKKVIIAIDSDFENLYEFGFDDFK